MQSKLLFRNFQNSLFGQGNTFIALFFICVFIPRSSSAQQSIGSIVGTVKTNDGKPVELATIFVPQIKRNAVTNKNGEFVFNRVPIGTYQIRAKFLSLAPQEFEVVVTNGKITNADFVLSQTSRELDEISVISNKTNKFGSKNTDLVARMPLENLENPQVYTSVSKELIAEQQIVDVKEILRNAPGVVPNNNPAGGTGGVIRGFNATTTVRNGLAVQSYQSDPINLERLEIIKGPSATLFGASIVSFGGLINQVTKKPLDTLKGAVELSLGSYELSRLTADFNTPLNKEKTALLRINAASHKENSFQNFGHKRMLTFAPSFLYKASPKLSFLLEAEYNQTDRSTVAYYQNLNRTTYRNFRDIPIDFKTSLGGSNIAADLTAYNYYAEAKYDISDQWISTTNVAYGENRIEHSNQIYPQWTADKKFDRAIFNYGPRVFTSINAQQNFNGDFKLGSLRNRIVMGLNYYSFRSFLRFTNVGVYDKIDLSASPVIPVINLEKVNATVATSAQSNTENYQRSYSAYASDVLNITPKLAAMLSLRIDRFENEAPVSNGIVATTGNFKQTAYSPKFGLNYEILKNQISVFGNYMNGFQNIGPITQPNGVIDIFKPRQANQWEGGLKVEALDKKLSATLSYYDIKISNDTRIVNTLTVQDGESKSKGFEAELIANPLPGLNIIAGYATNSYRITKATANVGNLQAQVPGKYGNLWASYKFTGALLKNFGLGFGGNYVADCFFDAENRIVIPDYTVLNGSVFFDQPKWRFGIKANNLANRSYWTNYGIPETLRQVIGSVSFKF